MNRETRLARQRLEPSRINGEVGPTAWATSSQHEWTPDQTTGSRSAFVSNQTGVARRCRSIRIVKYRLPPAFSQIDGL